MVGPFHTRGFRVYGWAFSHSACFGWPWFRIQGLWFGVEGLGLRVER